MTTVVTADYTLPGGQEIAGVNEDAFWAQGPDWHAIAINGRLSVTDSSKGLVFGGRIGAGDAFSGPHTFTIGASGVVSVTTTAPGGYAGGVVGYDGVKLVNLGSVDIHSTSEGVGLAGNRAGVENRGTISFNGARSGIGVTLDYGGSFANSGTITVIAGGSAFQGGAIGVILYQAGDSYTFQNSGTIRAAHVGTAATSTGVALAGYVNIVNSGLIEADQALIFYRDGIISGNGRHADITNTGVLRGEVFLNNTAAEPVTLRNSGTIEGAVTLNTGTDTYSGAEGSVSGPVRGEAGADSLLGGAGAESLSGGAGDDTIDGGAAGSDVLDGGDGIDTLSFAHSAVGVALDIGAQTVSTGVRISGFERHIGSSRDDTILGSAAANTLSGGAGADTIMGGQGDDRIDGGGGRGYLRGDEGADSLVGGSDFDDINGNMGADTASGGVGDDWVVGGKDNDSLAGDAGADLVYGNLGADTCLGGDGADIVRGGQDNDVVQGGAGDDFVSGDRGDDTMSGGDGADIFHTFGDAGGDRVLDFHFREGDRVQLDPGTEYTVEQVGFDSVITMAGGGRMILIDVFYLELPVGWIFGA